MMTTLTPELISVTDSKFVDPRVVRGINWLPFEHSKALDKDFSARVRIDVEGAPPMTIECGSDEAAQILAAAIGEQVNAYRRAANTIVA